MSIKVLTWAFGLTVEPRAKIALLAIADNADDDGVAWPSRDLIAQKSSQSRATVNRRMAYLTELGVLTVHERFRADGSQTTDEIRLNLALTSEEVMRRAQGLKASQKAENRPDDEDETSGESEGRGLQLAAPPCAASSPGVSDVQPPGYHCGNPQSEPSVEPNPNVVAAGARELIDRRALDLAEQLLVIAGHDPKFWPPGWCGAASRVHTWLKNGWQPENIITGVKATVARKSYSPSQARSVGFFEIVIAEEVARQAAPLPIVEVRQAEKLTVTRHGTANQGSGIIQAADRLNAIIDGFDDSPAREGPGGNQELRSEAGPSPVRLLSKG